MHFCFQITQNVNSEILIKIQKVICVDVIKSYGEVEV